MSNYANSGTNKNPMLQYEGGTAINVETVPAKQTVYVVGVPEDKKKAVGFGACCAFCCCLFLLLFFLIPRPPRAYLDSTTVYFAPYEVVQTYQVHNNNMYSLKLSDLDMTVSSDFTVGGKTLVGIGHFANNATSVTIPRLSTETVSINYYFNATALQVAQSSAQCYTSAGASYTTKGTISMETWSTDFSDVDLGPWQVTWYCS